VSRLSVSERVYLERVRLFFGHAGGNAVAIFIGAALLITDFYAANMSVVIMATWFGLISFMVACVLYIESLFKKSTLTIHNAKKWLIARVSSGLLLCSLYGVTPFLLPEPVRIQDEMFIFLILSAMMTVATISYSIMPMYYLAVNAVTMVPLTLYLASQPTTMHDLLVWSSVIVQISVLKSAWGVSKTTISAVYLNEELQDEMEHHLETKKQLEQMASQDSLTQLPNRRALVERLEMMVSEAKRYDHQVTAMFIDLDDFKQINDQFGHDAGDGVLREVARRLKGLIRESDMVARYGGDEFVFISANGVDAHDGLAPRILEALAKPIVLAEGSVMTTYGSIGIAQFPENGDSSESLISAADEAMYEVKKTGKSGFSLSDNQAA
jgi:diguanylate cyclase (GGDEF)-like protein